MLLFEVIKGARPGAKYLTDHLLSLIVFGGAMAEFLLWPRFGNSTYFLLTLLALADFLSGLALRSRRGVQAVAVAPVSRREARKADVVVAEPQFDPRPRLCREPRPPLRSPNPCCWSIRSRKSFSPKWRSAAPVPPSGGAAAAPQPATACRGHRTSRINSEI